MATPSAPQRLQSGPAKTLAAPALPSRLVRMRTMVPRSVFATSRSPCLLNSIPLAPSGPNEGTAGCTRPHGPADVVPKSSGLSDQIVKVPFSLRRQTAPPCDSETKRLPRRSNASPFHRPGWLTSCFAGPPAAGISQIPLPATATKIFRLWSSRTPSGNVEIGNVARVVMVPDGVDFTTEWAKGSPMYMLPRLSRAMLSGRLGGDILRTRVSPSLACAEDDMATTSTPANNAARRKRRLIFMLDPL